MKISTSMRAVIALTLICMITAAALAGINYATAPIIEQAELEKETAALRQVLPTGESFGDPIDTASLGLDSRITAVYREGNGEGYVFRITVKGYKSGLTVLCGIGSDGSVKGATCLSSSETLGHEKTYGDRFKGTDISSVRTVDTVSGATLTTKAYREAIELALAAYEILNK